MRRLIHRYAAVALGLWMALAPAVLAMPATAMAASMSLSMAAGSGDCDGCPHSGPAHEPCPLNCTTVMANAVLPDSRGIDVISSHGRYWPRSAVLSDHFLPPDPPPPKPVSLR